jgi:hypothetical protein
MPPGEADTEVLSYLLVAIRLSFISAKPNICMLLILETLPTVFAENLLRLVAGGESLAVPIHYSCKVGVCFPKGSNPTPSYTPSPRSVVDFLIIHLAFSVRTHLTCESTI